MTASTTTAPRSDAGMTHKQILEALSGLLLGLFVAILSSTVVSNALPRIITDLHGTQSGYTWVVTATLLATTASTPIWGKLSDLYSKKLLVQLSLVVFVVGSAIAGTSQAIGPLIAARVVQGLGAGGLTALSQVCIAAMIPPRERGRYSGYLGAVLAVATVAGPLIGGVIVDTSWLGWRWCFYVGVPFAVAAIILLQKTLHLPTYRRDDVRIDWVGATLITAAVSLLLVWVSLAGNNFDWWSWETIVMVLGAVVIGAAALFVESRAKEPIIPLTLFKVRSIALAVAGSLFVGIALFGSTVFLSQYFQTSRGDSPTQAGLSTMPLILGLFVSSLVSGRIITRTGKWKRFLVAGAVLITIGFAAMSTMRVDTPYALLATYMAVIGLGLGMTMQNLVLSVQNAVPITQLGAASSTVAFFRSLGGAVGVSALGAVLAHKVSSHTAEGLAALGIRTPASSGNQIPDLATLPAPVAQVIRTSYGIGAGDIFLVAAPITLLALIAVVLIREVPLRVTNAVPGDDPASTTDVSEADAVPAAAATAVLPVATAQSGANGAAQSGANGAARSGGNGAARSGGNGAARSGANGAARSGVNGVAGATPVQPRLLSNAALLSGSVFGPARQPIAGAVLTALDPTGGEVLRTTTGPAGTYRLQFPSGGTFLIVVSTTGHEPAVSTVSLAEGQLERNFMLDATGSVAGHVRDAAGRPRGGVSVTIIDARGEVVAVAITGPDGSYELTDLNPGDYTLTAISVGSKPAAYGVQLTNAGRTELDIDLPATSALRGQITSRSTGAPVPDAAVALLDAHGMVLSTALADGHGRYVFDAVTPGDYTVVASGYAPSGRTVRVGSAAGQELELRLGHERDVDDDALPSGRHSYVERMTAATRNAGTGADTSDDPSTHR
jgi:EmrB/QacA subfamily drug resistance transporter